MRLENFHCHNNLEVEQLKRSALVLKNDYIYNILCESLISSTYLNYFQGPALLTAFYADENPINQRMHSSIKRKILRRNFD